MPRITTKDLKRIASRVNRQFGEYKAMLLVCTGSGCVAAKGFDIRDCLNRELKSRGLERDYLVVGTGCNGFCAVGPIVVVQPEGVFYERIKEEDVAMIVTEHLQEGKPVERLLHRGSAAGETVRKMEEIPFFRKQEPIVLRNKGLIDPENIEHYIARGGYGALAKVLKTDGEAVIRDILASGIRGRGGGGFPVGLKWKSCRKAKIERNEPAYIVCNADEGDPGAFMDRSIIETDPHSVVEGMAIGAFAVGSGNGYVYLRNEYPLAMERLKVAVEQAREYGLLGDNILDSGFSFDIRIHRGAGAFVCGESTALMASMSGRVGEPRAKYVHNVEFGYRDRPTVLNNVETWANIPVIVEKGADRFASIGSGDVRDTPWGGSSGTKVFSLVGAVNNTGLVEVPMGITLREIVYDIGGGIPGGRRFKAVQTGGPSGGCIPEKLLDMGVDFDSLTKAGSMMGSGGMIVMDENNCMVDVARYFIKFLLDESCGKCTPCREGLYILSEVLDRIISGKGSFGDIELLEETSRTLIDASLCQLGGSAPNPVLSTVRYFREEYEAHIEGKKCPAGICKDLIAYSINDSCEGVGCRLCAKNCPVDAITGERGRLHVIDAETCVKCGVCREVCQYDAVEVT